MFESPRQPVGACTICRKRPTGMFSVSLHGEVTCANHATDERCIICGRPRPVAGAAGWRLLGLRHASCPTCADGAICDQHDVRRVLPKIRTELANLGFELRQPVRVTLATIDELSALLHKVAGPNDPTTFGITMMEDQQPQRGPAAVLNVQILGGLPPAVFGRTVAHEAAHAWAAQVGARAVEPMIEEGMCELIAFGWLKRQPGRLAEGLRGNIVSNPDPIYGDGFRAVQQAVRTRGIKAVLASLQRTGRLPDQPQSQPRRAPGDRRG